MRKTTKKARYITLSTFKKNNWSRREDVARQLGYTSADQIMSVMKFPNVAILVK